MTKIRRIDFSFDEWIAGCLGLTEEQEGIYIRLTARHGSRGKRLQVEGLASYCNSDKRKFWRIANELWALGKVKIYDHSGAEISRTSGLVLPEVGDSLAVPRTELELSLAQSRSDLASNLANKRWNNNGVGDAAPHMRTRNANHQPSYNPPNPPQGGNGFNRRDPFGLNGLDESALIRRYKASTNQDERDAINRALGF